jgi:hypothetical protein
LGKTKNSLRWGFVKKVYEILSVQILLMTIVAGFVVYFEGLKTFFPTDPGLVLFLVLCRSWVSFLILLTFRFIKQVLCESFLLGFNVIAL